MAYTHIHKITGTVNLSLDYVMNDKTGEITYHTLTTTMNCNPAKPVETFYQLMSRFGREEVEHGNGKTKDGKPVLAWHLYQSFEGFLIRSLQMKSEESLQRNYFRTMRL